MFSRDPKLAAAMATLTPRQRTAFAVFVIGSVLPVVLLGVVRLVFWLIACQLACFSGVAYMRWRSSALQGSLITVVLGSITCVTTVVAGISG